MIDFTTASRQEIRQVYNAIAAGLGDDRFFTTKELDVLPKILAPYEQVISFSSGVMDGNSWLIVLTDRRVLFVDKGLLYGLKQASIPVESIVTIDGQTGLMFGTIRISTAAGPREIRNVWKKTVNPFINKVDEAMRARREGRQLLSPMVDAKENDTPDQPTPDTSASMAADRQAAAPSAQATDHERADDMRRLDRLRNAGAIDELEYQRQKAGLR